MKKIILNLLLLSLLSISCDKKDDEKNEKVTTDKVYSIAATEAYVEATFNGVKCPTPQQRGVCWNTTPSPTIENSKEISEGCDGGGVFVIKGLTSKKKYYVRAYSLSTNSDGIVYGNELSFTTK